MSSKISREIRQPLVAHQSAKFGFWGQYLMFGPPSHALAKMENLHDGKPSKLLAKFSIRGTPMKEWTTLLSISCVT